MLYFKAGVKMETLSPQIVLGLISVHAIFVEYGYGSLTITSICDGVHKSGSLHYRGNAVDIRTSDMSPIGLKNLVSRVSKCLGDNFDVVLEPTHLHIEYDPR